MPTRSSACSVSPSAWQVAMVLSGCAPAFWLAEVYVATVSEQTIAADSGRVMGGLAHGVASYRSWWCNPGIFL